ncbi:MAG: hypothetical protein GEU82_02880 [Luteitalea sp.]|nr:hypothetical protein [Luteitalea sp.]
MIHRPISHLPSFARPRGRGLVLAALIIAAGDNGGAYTNPVRMSVWPQGGRLAFQDVTAQATPIEIQANENIQARVDATEPGSMFLLKAGVHRMQTIRPRNGDVFIGEAGTVLSGARPLTSFTRVASGTRATGSAYVSDREWTFESNGWGPAQRDRSNGETAGTDGSVLALNGQTFAKGIGVHAPSDLRLALAGGCSSFTASVGVDDEVGPLGSVVFQVWADGLKLYDSGVLSGDSGTQDVNVDVSGRNDLQLLVLDAGDHSHDHADWADAQLSCSQPDGYWVATSQTQQGALDHRGGGCQAAHPRCWLPEQLFIDDKALLHVDSLAELRPGTFYFDYDADEIFFADDPVGRRVETSVTPTAFAPTADNVTISGLTIERFASLDQRGAIEGSGRTGWVITSNEVRANHGQGIRVGSHAQVRSNYVHHNGQLGIAAIGEEILVENNEIAFNNTASYFQRWESGGAKFMHTTNLVVRGNFAHHNDGPGLWTDMDCLNTLYENNVAEDNRLMGILHEISYAAVIRDNIVRRNGFGLPDWIAGAGILVAASADVEVYGNLVEGNADGIGGMQQDRGSGQWGPYQVRNLWVHDNVITNSEGWAAGLAQDVDGSTDYFTSRNNRFENNRYELGSATFPFVWMNGDFRTAEEWVAYGQDVTGTFSR